MRQVNIIIAFDWKFVRLVQRTAKLLSQQPAPQPLRRTLDPLERLPSFTLEAECLGDREPDYSPTRKRAWLIIALFANFRRVYAEFVRARRSSTFLWRAAIEEMKLADPTPPKCL